MLPFNLIYMLKFLPFTDKCLKKIQKYTEKSPYFNCDFSAGVLFMWNDVYNLSYAEYNSTLILKCNFLNKKTVFMLPSGKDFEGALSQIEDYAVENGIKLAFMCVEEDNLNFLRERYNDKLTFSFNRDFSDYIYDYNSLLTLVGKKFSGQRNHINNFNKNYPNHKFKKITKKDIEKIKAFLQEYKKEHKNGGKIEKNELKNTLKLLDNYNLAKYQGGYVEIDGEIASFTIGEYVGKTLIIHVEKALKKYKGIYPATFNMFLRSAKKDGVEFINREDDSGDIGLRTSKTQYQPIRLLNNHYVEIKKPMNVTKKPTLKGEKVLLRGILEQDKDFYYKLYVSKTLNKYWGYDYKKDIVNPTPDAFFNLQYNDFKNKNNLCLLVADKVTKKPVGEVVLHNFNYKNQVEIGIRIIKKEHGKGYGKDAVKMAINYAVNVLKKQPVAKCFIKNQASLKCLKSAGFTEKMADKKFYYLEYKV